MRLTSYGRKNSNQSSSLTDFTFHIQNFTTATFSKAVKPGQQATVGYSFVPADAFAGRPIGLTINLNYRDAAGNFFIDPVFNETVQIVEFDEGFDTETFFMYVCMAGAVVLLLFLGFNFLSGQSTKVFLQFINCPSIFFKLTLLILCNVSFLLSCVFRQED